LASCRIILKLILNTVWIQMKGGLVNSCKFVKKISAEWSWLIRIWRLFHFCIWSHIPILVWRLAFLTAPQFLQANAPVASCAIPHLLPFTYLLVHN
jgi:hypothetical protein